jgi:hypothetical protein
MQAKVVSPISVVMARYYSSAFYKRNIKNWVKQIDFAFVYVVLL